MRTAFGEILPCVETWVYWHHICDYCSNVLAPLLGQQSTQLPGWSPTLTLHPVLDGMSLHNHASDWWMPSCLPRPNARMKYQHSLKKMFIFHHLPLRRQAMLCELPPCLQGDKILVSTQHCLVLQTSVLFKLLLSLFTTTAYKAWDQKKLCCECVWH